MFSVYLTRKLHLDVVTEQEDALPGVDEDAAVGVGRVESHRLSLFVSEPLYFLFLSAINCRNVVTHSKLSAASLLLTRLGNW